jgi:hypothetical protein
MIKTTTGERRREMKRVGTITPNENLLNQVRIKEIQTLETILHETIPTFNKEMTSVTITTPRSGKDRDSIGDSVERL